LSVSTEKEKIRQRIWKVMEERGVAAFPKPIFGRIPNFDGAERAAERLVNLQEFKNAHTVKVNPDSPQIPVREEVLSQGKLLIMPSPRLEREFLVVDPTTVPKGVFRRAATIRGVFKFGRSIDIDDLPRVDLVVCGSVAVSRNGSRVGKGGGYSEIEYGILRELGLISEETPVFTTVHDLQIVDRIPREEHDFLVDAVVTPTRVVRIKRGGMQPTGIYWAKVTPSMLENMPILASLRKRTRGEYPQHSS